MITSGIKPLISSPGSVTSAKEISY